MKHTRATSRWLITGTVAAMVLTSCSSRSNEDDTSKEGVDTSGATSEVLTAPKALPVTTPIGKDVPTGLTVAYLYNGIDQSTLMLNGMKDAAKELGWTLEPFTYDPTNPASYAGAAQSAIASKPAALVTTALVKAQLDPILGLAKQAGVPVIDTLSSNEPQEGVYSIFRTPEATAYAADLLVEQVKADAKKAKTTLNVAQSTVPQFAETIGVVTTQVEAGLKEDCDGCKHEDIEISVQDVFSGKYVQQIVSFLQRKPDVNVLISNVAQLDLGLDAALAQAGAGSITRYGVGPSSAQIKALQGGGSGAWAMYPFRVIGWSVIDTVARVVSGDTSNPWNEAKLSYVVNKENAASVDADDPVFPAGYEDMFRTLWSK